MRRIILMLLLLYTCSHCWGQEISKYPQYNPLQAFQTPTTGVIDIHDKTASFYADISYRQFAGVFSDVRQFSTKAYVKLKKSDIGLFAYSSKEGELISRSRLYCKYTINIPLTKKYSLKGGTSLGVISKNYNHNISKWNGSTSKLDLDIGAGLKADDFLLAFSINQIPSSTLSIFDMVVHYPLYYTLFIKKEFAIQKERVKLSANHEILKNAPDAFSVQAGWKHNDKVGIAMALSSQGFMIVNGEISFTKSKTKTNLIFGYETQTNLFNAWHNVSMYHVGIQFYFNNEYMKE